MYLIFVLGKISRRCFLLFRASPKKDMVLRIYSYINLCLYKCSPVRARSGALFLALESHGNASPIITFNLRSCNTCVRVAVSDGSVAERRRWSKYY